MSRRGVVVGTAVVLLAGAGASAGAAGADRAAGPVVGQAVVNQGRDVVVGTTQDVTFPVTVTGSGDPALTFVDVDLKGPNGGFYTTDAFCESATACTTAFTVNAHLRPGGDDPVDLTNAQAGTWSVDALADTADGTSVFARDLGAFSLKRAARLTVNASPEPATEGSRFIVTGRLERADWDTYRYRGYAGQMVKLQFRPKDSSAYATVATARTSSTGALHIMARATEDGYWRWHFAGTATTGAAKATGDYVDVRP
ncbi:calcium-binding protein [Streptomyces nigra]|uniref:calcium-binding protein n=1 Tax=Streptomyces nigra TaxID=1827580 RepID=UPI003823440F